MLVMCNTLPAHWLHQLMTLQLNPSPMGHIAQARWVQHQLRATPVSSVLRLSLGDWACCPGTEDCQLGHTTPPLHDMSAWAEVPPCDPWTTER